ncbi:hypothetical protein [Streptomyces sp. ODS05-4]|uniref:hypothetical protein n=1 Tax=Streptomyces sp. ODS05-4 TaxID=2944939 RepID=UPI00210F061F|nr:hypothetical protein [Streptomyces sp. ODS05-4]
MDAAEAQIVDAVLRRHGIDGAVAPVNPDRPGGAWSVYDQADPAARREVTGVALAALAAAVHRPPSGPQRGFIVPPPVA